MSTKLQPTLAVLRELFELHPETLQIQWRVRPRHHFASLRSCNAWNSRFPGKPVGRVWKMTKGGPYRTVTIATHGLYRILVHRIVHALYSGEEFSETKVVDHINGDTLDNHPSNLRLVTQLENMRNRTRLNKNNKTGVRGVCLSRGKYRAALHRMGGRMLHVGTFDDLESAAKAIADARAKYHAEVPA